MIVHFSKYHALRNDFLIIDLAHNRVPIARREALAIAICDRRSGVGADGVLFLTGSRRADFKIDLHNADGGWAEKSGNGLRIAAVHKHLTDRRRRAFTFEMGGIVASSRVMAKDGSGFSVSAGLGKPIFESASVPVRSRRKYMIQAPLRLGGKDFPVTCLAVGNPHTVLFVDDFDFDWQALGDEIEHLRCFPERTNVEFVKVINRHKLKVADWERGAGATGSSGTGAAAAVCAAVMIGRADRRCQVIFEAGSLYIWWDSDTSEIELTGQVQTVCEGAYVFK
ncbi:MAG: diaminopimelate epimerase [candidate division Zixibacteria bacterium]|nr:diaminopimelate epimerase [candidate division Zixibacteria bacterium]